MGKSPGNGPSEDIRKEIKKKQSSHRLRMGRAGQSPRTLQTGREFVPTEPEIGRTRDRSLTRRRKKHPIRGVSKRPGGSGGGGKRRCDLGNCSEH